MLRAGRYAFQKKNFPSKAVRVELKQRWDEDSDGKLSPSEIKKVKYLIVFASEDEKKTSLKGMQYFYNLKSVDLDVQTMNHIDLRKNKKLESLEISEKIIRSKILWQELENSGYQCRAI